MPRQSFGGPLGVPEVRVVEFLQWTALGQVLQGHARLVADRLGKFGVTISGKERLDNSLNLARNGLVLELIRRFRVAYREVQNMGDGFIARAVFTEHVDPVGRTTSAIRLIGQEDFTCSKEETLLLYSITSSLSCEAGVALTSQKYEVKEGVVPSPIGRCCFASVAGIEGLNQRQDAWHIGGDGGQEQPEPMIRGPSSVGRKRFLLGSCCQPHCRLHKSLLLASFGFARRDFDSATHETTSQCGKPKNKGLTRFYRTHCTSFQLGFR